MRTVALRERLLNATIETTGSPNLPGGRHTKKTFTNPDGPEAAALIEELVAALEKQGLALAAWVNILRPHCIITGNDGDPILTVEHSWARDPSKEEVQAALEAQNDAAVALAKAHHPEEVLKWLSRR
jgi:hypothetical protein